MVTALGQDQQNVDDWDVNEVSPNHTFVRTHGIVPVQCDTRNKVSEILSLVSVALHV